MADRPGVDATAEVGRGFLPQTSAVVYRVIVLQLCFVAAAAPGLLLSTLISPDLSNAPWHGLALVPLAPALSALLYGWRQTVAEGDLQPGRHFWQGYRMNLPGVLSWWLPATLVLTVLLVNAAHLSAVSRGPALLVLGLGTLAAAALVLVSSAHALVLTSLFSVRLRDLLRLLPRLVRMPGPTLGALALLVSGFGLAGVTSDWILAGLATPAMVALLHFARPMILDIEKTFVP